MKTFPLNESSLNEIKCFTFDEFVMEKQKRQGEKLNEKKEQLNEQDGADVSIKGMDDLQSYINDFIKKNKMTDKFNSSTLDSGAVMVTNLKIEDVDGFEVYAYLKVKKGGKGVDNITVDVGCESSAGSGKFEQLKDIKLTDVLVILASKEMKADPKTNKLTQTLVKDDSKRKIVVKDSPF